MDDDPLDELKREFERRVEEIRSQLGERRHVESDDSVDYLKNDLGRIVSDLRLLLNESVEPGREMIRERPFLALGIALGVGVLVGVILGRKGKE